MIWTLVILALIILAWYGFEGRWDHRLFKAEQGRICANLHPQGVKDYLAAHPETQVLDVRSDAEFSNGSLPGACHISIGDPAFEGKVSQLDKARPVLVYCAGGFRSRKAVEKLKVLGFTNIQHLHRGYQSWKMAGF